MGRYKTVQPSSGGGAERLGETGPNKTRDFVPTAAAMCIGAESLLMQREACFMIAAVASISLKISVLTAEELVASVIARTK
jgi:hypothetical protein